MLMSQVSTRKIVKRGGTRRMKKKAKRRKLLEEQEMRDEKKRKLDEEQELRDAKKNKRLKAAAGMRLVRSPVAMIAKVMSLRKQMSPQANSGMFAYLFSTYFCFVCYIICPNLLYPFSY
jgi:hypothetical protein